MKLIINTSFLPYFCTLFDGSDNLIDSCFWEDGKSSSTIIWGFFSKHEIKKQSVDFIGAVTGPGGFSHLRTSSVIMHALKFYFQLPIHQARADKIISNFLTQKGHSSHFLLNSFGQGFFVPKEENIIRYENFEALPQRIKETPQWISLLPEEKQKHFNNTIICSLEGIEKSTLQVLQKKAPKNSFVPDYEYPPV